LPPVLIASAERNILHVEAERYAAALIAAGVPTEMTRHRNVSHFSLAGHAPVLRDVAFFFRRRLAPGYRESAKRYFRIPSRGQFPCLFHANPNTSH
jgi:acetyl esterase/lipase